MTGKRFLTLYFLTITLTDFAQSTRYVSCRVKQYENADAGKSSNILRLEIQTRGVADLLVLMKMNIQTAKPGGENLGDPGQTSFPLRFELDYVRVFKKKPGDFYPVGSFVPQKNGGL